MSYIAQESNRRLQLKLNPSKLTFEDVKPKVVKMPVTTYKETIQKPYMRLKQDDYLWEIDFTEWSKAKSVQKFSKGTEFELADIVTNKLGAKYGRTPYSKQNNILNGINMKVVEIFYKWYSFGTHKIKTH